MLTWRENGRLKFMQKALSSRPKLPFAEKAARLAHCPESLAAAATRYLEEVLVPRDLSPSLRHAVEVVKARQRWLFGIFD